MASLGDVLDQLKQANSTLANIHDDLLGALQKSNTDLEAIQTTLQAGFGKMEQGFLAVIEQQKIGNLIGIHLTKQVDTVICALEHISKNTCASLNEDTTQTHLARDVAKAARAIEFIAATTQPGAALEAERLRVLERKMEECCKKEPPPPPCSYDACPKPPPLELPDPSPPR